jgi:hypothetical protein
MTATATRKLDRRARMTGKLGMQHGQCYALIPEEVMESAAYHAQPDWARTVLFALACGATQHNNGNLSLAFSDARRRGIAAQWKLYAGLRLLERADLVICTRRGHLERGMKLPSLFGITWRGINPAPEKITYDFGVTSSPIPTNAWAAWVKPDTWKQTIQMIVNSNRGTSKLTKKPHTQMLGNDRSQVLGATATDIAPSSRVTEEPQTAPRCLVTSKTLVRGSTRTTTAGRRS